MINIIAAKNSTDLHLKTGSIRAIVFFSYKEAILTGAGTGGGGGGGGCRCN